MISPVKLPPVFQRLLVDWIRRLADRLWGIQDRIKEAVIEAVGRTAAEVTETVLRTCAPPAAPEIAGPPVYRTPDPADDWDNDYAPSGSREVCRTVREEPEPRSARRGLWWAAMLAGLQAGVWWLQSHATGPVLTALAAVATASLLLLN
jgi:hypothetical protein